MGGGCTHAQSLAEVVKVVFVQQYNVVFVVIIAQFLDRGGEQQRRVKLQLFKKSFPCFAHCAEDRGVWWWGGEEKRVTLGARFSCLSELYLGSSRN